MLGVERVTIDLRERNYGIQEWRIYFFPGDSGDFSLATDAVVQHLSGFPDNLLRDNRVQDLFDGYRQLIPNWQNIIAIQEKMGDRDQAILKNIFPYTEVLRVMADALEGRLNLSGVTTTHDCLWFKTETPTIPEVEEMVGDKYPESLCWLGKCY